MTDRLRVDVPALLARLGIRGERRGRALWAPCPYHEEKEPSWSIIDDVSGSKHGYHHCFGCKEGGGPVALVMQVVGLETPKEAREWLGGASVERVAEEVSVRFEQGRSLRPEFVLPQGVVTAPLGEWVTPARRYAEERGVTPAQVEQWGIGYAVTGRLGGRLVFPVRTAVGRLISYTARTYVGAVKRYLEPGSDEWPDKAAVFGEEWWPEARVVVVVTEGALDGLAVQRAAGLPFGAVYGSELLPGHLARLATFDAVVIASDPDPAGDKLFAAIDGAMRARARVSRARLPAKVDPCKLERMNPGALREVISAALHRDR